MWNFPLSPEQASTMAGRIDLFYWVLVALSLLFIIPIAGAIIYLSIKYRAGANVDRSNPLETDIRLEMTWIVVPLALSLGVFVWSSLLYMDLIRPPDNALQINIVGRQWMWKAQHPTGQGEINTLHVPLGQPVKLIMTSQDVIHSFYVPAFRIKQDVLPGRYTETWFEASKVGTYNLFCAEYCGTEHSLMGGSIIVMEPTAYQEWLSTGGINPSASQQSPVAQGAGLFQQLGCIGCHNPSGGGAGPSLVGVFGKEQPLEGGQTVTVDENYVRESIVEPQAKIAAGYQPVMPSYKGQISEEQIMNLIEYIKSLDSTTPAAQAGSTQ